MQVISYIVHTAYQFEKSVNGIQFAITRVVDKAGTSNGVTWVEEIWHGRIVDDDALSEVAIDQRQVFDVVSIMQDTVFTVQSMTNGSFRVQSVQKRIRVFTQTSSVDDNFVVLCHFSKE